MDDHLAELARLLHDARASWESIATQLRLPQGDVDAIAKMFGNPKDCLRESLKLWLRGVDPIPTREQLARALQSPPVGRNDIALQLYPELEIVCTQCSTRFVLCSSKLIWVIHLCSLLLCSALIMIPFNDNRGSIGKSLSLPVVKHELIGREDEMKVILGYFRESEVDVVTLYGQAGFGKSEIALHVGHM